MHKDKLGSRSGRLTLQAAVLFFFLKYSWFTRIRVCSDAIQGCTYTGVFLFRFVSIVGYYKILKEVPRAMSRPLLFPCFR